MSPYRTPSTRAPIDIYVAPMPRRTLTERRVMRALAVVGILTAVRLAVGCGAATTAEKTAGAAVLYEEQQRACVQQYADTAHIDACRDKVKKAWATDAGAKDGAS